jgi:hypothetical protein
MKKETLYECASRYYTALHETFNSEKELEKVLKVEFSDSIFERTVIENVGNMMFCILQDYMGEYKVDADLLEEFFFNLHFDGEIRLYNNENEWVDTITEPKGIIDWFIENK